MRRLPPATRTAAPLLALVLFAACTAGPASAPSASSAPSTGASAASATATASPSAPPDDRPSATPHGQQVPQTPAASPITGEVPADILASVRAKLAAKIGDAAAASATVEVAQAVTWPDGSLGCLEPGMLYTQMVVQGYQVVLAVDGTRYDYRVGAGGSPSLCVSRLPHTPTAAP